MTRIEDKILKCPAGELIFAEGDHGEIMYVIISGKVAIYRTVEGNRIDLATLEKGDFFGEMALLERQPRTASAEIAEDVEILQISPADFDEMLKRNTEIAIRIMRKYSQRLRHMHRLLEEQYRSGEIHLETASPHIPKTKGADSLLGNLKSVERGNLFPINSEQVLVGRRDAATGISPDIDLTDEDILNSVSRQHAWLDYRDGCFYVTEEVGVGGGTFINENRLVPGRPEPIQSGDQIRFGYVLLAFYPRV